MDDVEILNPSSSRAAKAHQILSKFLDLAEREAPGSTFVREKTKVSAVGRSWDWNHSEKEKQGQVHGHKSHLQSRNAKA